MIVTRYCKICGSEIEYIKNKRKKSDRVLVWNEGEMENERRGGNFYAKLPLKISNTI